MKVYLLYVQESNIADNFKRVIVTAGSKSDAATSGMNTSLLDLSLAYIPFSLSESGHFDDDDDASINDTTYFGG